MIEDRIKGCLLGGAVGDALGAPVEFMSLSEIKRTFGNQGVTDYSKAHGRRGAITDDTQMTLFTAEGLLRAHTRKSSRTASVVRHAYIRWLNTQGEKSESKYNGVWDGWLYRIPELHSRRAPGNSCLSALRSHKIGKMENPINDSKGCGGVMRIAPVGLFYDDPLEAFEVGCEIAAVTHGHPTGYLVSGCLTAIISFILSGHSLDESIKEAVRILKAKEDSEECVEAINTALRLVRDQNPTPNTVENIGEGWIAEEALAISIYCALCYENDFTQGVLLAVNHGGDSDSTGAITGNILGALLGKNAIPNEWLDELELRNVIEEISSDLNIKFKDEDSWRDKYPGW